MAGLIDKQMDTSALDRFGIAAMTVIHNQQVSDQLIAMMKQATDPVEGLAQAADVVMRQLLEKAKGSIPQKAIVNAAQVVILLLAELATQAQVFQVTRGMLGQAFQKLFSKKSPTQAQPAMEGA